MDKRERKFLLLQINDSTFPIGAYSHSYGLETYIQKELVDSPESAYEYIKNKIAYSLSSTELLSARIAYELALEGKTEKLKELEEILRASRVPKEIREAGDKLGSRFIKTVSSFDLDYENPVFAEFIKQRKNEPVFYPVAYGVFCASVGIGIREALENYLYAQTSSMVTNSVKSIPLSQTDGQKILIRLIGEFDSVIDEVIKLSEEDLCRTTPGFDLRSMEHEKLYSRIYMS